MFAVAGGLLGGLAGIPVTDELLAVFATDTYDDVRLHPGWMLKPRVCRLAQDLSASRRVPYVSGETFGSLCCQEAAGWRGWTGMALPLTGARNSRRWTCGATQRRRSGRCAARRASIIPARSPVLSCGKAAAGCSK
jgi:hypothetical protein